MDETQPQGTPNVDEESIDHTVLIGRDDAPEPSKAPPPKPKYYIVKIQASRDETDQPFQPVNVGGKRYVLTRGLNVPVPQAVIDVLDRATYMHWENVEGESRKIGTPRHRTPHTRFEITEEGYHILRKIALERKLTQAEADKYRI